MPSPRDQSDNGGFPGSVVKNLPPNAGYMSSIPGRSGRGSGRFAWRRKLQPTPVFLYGKSHGHRNVADYSPWGHKIVTHNLATKKKKKSNNYLIDKNKCSLIVVLIGIFLQPCESKHLFTYLIEINISLFMDYLLMDACFSIC